jgi:preprotein translocase SecF subunit
VLDVVGRRRWYFLFSAIITLPGLVFLILTPLSGGTTGLKFSIDYTGGTRWEIRFQDPAVTADQIKTVLVAQGLDDSVVSPSRDGFFDLRMPPVNLSTPPPTPTPAPTLQTSASPSASGAESPAASGAESPAASGSAAPSGSDAPSGSVAPGASPSVAPGESAGASASASASESASPSPTPVGAGELPTSGQLGEVVTALQTELGPIAEQRILTTIGPVVSADLINQAFILILVGAIGILLWITLRFHDVKFGVTAIITTLHDVLVIVGLFAILGTLFGIEIDALFVTAMLTVIGFSVHDTIVVFDRIRENKARHAGEPFDRIVNHSILQTAGRSVSTSFTVFITLLALLLFGGAAIRTFVLALLVGIASGTYSSIFNAAPLLVVWQEWEERRKARQAALAKPRRANA